MDLVLEKNPVMIVHLVPRLIPFAVSLHCVTTVKNDFSVKLKIFQKKLLFVGECL